jgi:tetratricopeptide (TPR) repeat protein
MRTGQISFLSSRTDDRAGRGAPSSPPSRRQAAGDKAKAIEYYEKALRIDPKFPSSIEALKKLKI